MKHLWPEILGSVIGIAIMSPLLVIVWRNSHWSVALLLSGLYFEWATGNLKQRIEARRKGSGK